MWRQSVHNTRDALVKVLPSVELCSLMATWHSMGSSGRAGKPSGGPTDSVPSVDTEEMTAGNDAVCHTGVCGLEVEGVPFTVVVFDFWPEAGQSSLDTCKAYSCPGIVMLTGSSTLLD